MSTENLWIRRFHPSERARVRLVCLPHAGGSASFWFPVSHALSPEVDVVCVQYPGRQDRRDEPGLDSITALADGVTAALGPWQDLPLAFLGHSMGALVGFEVASRLQERGVLAETLFVSARRAPSRYRSEHVHLRTDEEVVAELRALSGTESDLLGDDEIVRMILPAVRSDYRAVETYRYTPRPPLKARVVALAGESDPRVDVAEVAAWEEHTAGAFELRTFPGGHFFLAPHREAVLTVLRENLL
ncbi:thioesterase II family protein [Streptomyces sp. NPDC058335]|uniref:thioesterase II family protein n=1 Tax=Streptomyces sp. NPDC058335 TaxID=3346451 RepID=UPI0036583A60